MPPLRRDFDLAGVRAARAEFLTFSVPFLRRRPLFRELFTRNFIFLVRKNIPFVPVPRVRAREAVKSPPVNTVSGDTMRAIAESSLLRGLMLHGFAWAPDELVGGAPSASRAPVPAPT